MTEPGNAVLPYSCVVGQEQLKTALELSYIAPRIGGVLATGDRGTAKSMTVRAFSIMMNTSLPVTLPINATDDRVFGGWRLDELVRGRAVEQRGLLEEAGEKGVLYVDEINLLDDHVVNIILDVSSTGILTIQREGVDRQVKVEFTLVGTMNPDEGGLRPQLLDRFGLSVDVRAETDPAQRRKILDRFGLSVDVRAETDPAQRRKILDTVLRFDEARARPDDPFLRNGKIGDADVRTKLTAARERLYDVKFESDMTSLCAELAVAFQVSGHRGDVVTALAARALAARVGCPAVTRAHVRTVAPLALQHRRSQAGQRGPVHWTAEDQQRLDELAG